MTADAQQQDASKASQTPKTDYLLESLVYLTQHYGRAKSATSLKAGLPYDEKGMRPSVFLESAKRLGLKVKIQEKDKPETISAEALPVVVIQKNDKAFVLVSIDGDKAKVFTPETEEEEIVLTSSLKNDYAGHIIYVHPSAEFHDDKAPHKKDYANHWFWAEFLNVKSIYAKVIVASIFINIFALTSPIFIMNVYDRVIPNNALETGWVLGIGALAIYIFDFIMRTLRGYFIDIAGRRIDVISATKIYDQVLNMRVAEQPKSSGMFASILKEFDSVRDFLTSATLTTVVDLPFTLFFLFIIYLIGGGIAVLLMLLIMMVIGVGVLLQKPLQNAIAKSMYSSEAKHGILVESIQALETIKAINADGTFRMRYGQMVGESAVHNQKARFISALGVNLASFLQQSASIMIVLVGMYLVQSQSLSVGGLIAVVILGGRVIAPIGQIANLLARYHQSRSAYQSVEKLMHKDVERPRDKQFLHRPDLSGAIKFDKVSFGYPDTQAKALDTVSFNIKAGEKVGIIGRIGSGKSTIAKLIMGLYQPDEGSILYDNTDHRQIDPADLRRNTGYISQDVILFGGSIRDNITASHPQASEEDVLWASKAAGAHEFIAKHPMGYDARLGEGGSGLSGGQRQAIAMARALLIKPNMLVCDEPTNAMDMQAEEMFTKHIAKEAKDRTLILITHRMHLLSLVDRLILLDNGRVLMDNKRDKVLQALQGQNPGDKK